MPSPLDRILEVSRRLAASADLREILPLIIDAMRDLLDAERATVFQYHAATQELVTTVAHGVNEGDNDGGGLREIRVPVTSGLAGECARARRIIRVDDAYADPRFNRDVDHRSGFRTRSIITFPLVDHDGELVGVAQVLNKRSGAFRDADEQVAAALAAHAAVALRRGRLIEDRLARLRLERELEVARLIQQTSFPARIPQPQGFQIAAWNQPATETGGDVYDIVEFAAEDSNRLVLLMADATGHGVGPAISVTQLRSMFRMAVRLGADLHTIAEHVNAQLSQDLPAGRFITAWLGELDAARGILRSFSAGQAPLLLCRANTGVIESLSADTVPLGVLEDLSVHTEQSIELLPGDIFAVFSDGIFEARSAAGEQFNVSRAATVLRDAPASRESADQIIQRLQTALAAYVGNSPASDDRTAIVIRRQPV